MLLSTLPLLRCPSRTSENRICSGALSLLERSGKNSPDVLFGTLGCKKCPSIYPILAGVAVIVNDVESYLQFHVKGVSALVSDRWIPAPCRESYLRAKAEIQTGHAEEDLESQRINALYFMNHFLSAKGAVKPWWRPDAGAFSAEIDRLIKKFWDHGPFSRIAGWTRSEKCKRVIELGCGVGGLARFLAPAMDSYLGVDSAFASIALARHVYLGAPYALPLRIPQDLFHGPLTGKVRPPKHRLQGVDFVVGEIEGLPVVKGTFDLCVALNTIDMIPDPKQLPRLQYGLLKNGGIAIQSCPYIWHKNVAKRLRRSLPKSVRSSSAAVELLYQRAGLEIFRKVDHLPWLFLKHFRQIELYSVHLFAARKAARR